MSNPCPVIVPLASVAVFWLPPESRKWLKRLRWGIFKSYRPDQSPAEHTELLFFHIHKVQSGAFHEFFSVKAQAALHWRVYTLIVVRMLAGFAAFTYRFHAMPIKVASCILQ